MTLAQEYIDRYDGRVDKAAEAFAHDLMRGDPETFKAGYDAPNAFLATVEVFDLTADETAELRDTLQFEHERTQP